MEASDVQVCFTQLFPSPTAAVAATVGIGTGGRHLVAGGHIGLLQEKKKYKEEINIYYCVHEHWPETDVIAKILITLLDIIILWKLLQFFFVFLRFGATVDYMGAVKIDIIHPCHVNTQ